MRMGLAYILGLYVLLLLGCDAERNPALAKLSSGDVLAQVGACRLTKRQFQDESAMRMALLRLADKNLKSKDVASAEVGIRSGILTRFIQNSLIDGLRADFLATNAAPDYAARYETNRLEVAREMSAAFSVGGARGVDAVAKLLSGRQADVLRATQNSDLENEAFLRTAYGRDFQLTEEQCRKGVERIKVYNRNAAATNALNLALAQRVRRELAADPDPDFAKYADRYSQDPEKQPGGDMGECDESDFAAEEGHWDTISKLAPGEISDVIKTSVGWEIVKCWKHLKPEEANSRTDSRVLSRIFFRRAMECREDYTVESFREEMEGARRESVLKKLLLGAWKKHGVSFPHGYRKLGLHCSWEKVEGFPKEKDVGKEKK